MFAPATDHVDEATARAFIDAHPWALIVTNSAAGPRATHLPVLSVARADGKLELHTHMARANPQWRDFGDAPVLVVFSGPHAYVSPRHYERADAVPTWNYVAVHTLGRARLVTDRDAAYAQQCALVERFDPEAAAQLPALSAKYLDGLLGAIVAFIIDVDRIEARFKLSNDKTPAERERVIAALESASDSASVETAQLMKRHRP